MGIKGIERLECITVFTKSHLSLLLSYIYLYSTLYSFQVKKNWKCDSEELLERKLVVYFALHYSRKRFFRKRFDLELWDWSLFKPAAHLRKELSKLPREAVCSGVSSRVRGNCCEKLALRGREDKIKHVWYFWPREANSSMCAAIVRLELSLV